MAKDIDKKDKKILFYLSQNARMSDTQLAKKVGLSKNAVKYRINRLKEFGIITKFTTLVNLGLIGYNTFTMLIRFNKDIYKNTRIIEYFREHRRAGWIVTLSGGWDIFVEFVSSDIRDLCNLITELLEHFNEEIESYSVYLSDEILRVEHLIPDIYKELNVKMPENERHFSEHKIDESDKKILSILSEDSSKNLQDIASEANLTLDIVRYRIKNLTKSGIILKFSSEISLKKLGYSEYLSFIKIKNPEEEKLRNLKKDLKSNPNITYSFFDPSTLTAVFASAFKSNDDMDALLRKLRHDFYSIVGEQNYLIIREQVLFNLFPRGLS